MSFDIRDGHWFSASTEEEFDEIRKKEYITYATYCGPGKYMIVAYEEPCGRGCCWDNVRKTLSAWQVESLVKDEIKKLDTILKEARS